MYFETDPTTKGSNLYELLWVSHKIENAFFEGFEPRLKFDYELEKKRKGFSTAANRARVAFVKKFNIQRPSSAPRFPYA
jgi:hypothetical protein